MPILGVVASSSRQGQGPTDLGAMFPISAVTVGTGGAASVVFSSIPQTYTHLQVRVFQKSNSAGDLNFKFNSDSSSSYPRHFVYGQGSSAAAGGSGTEAQGYIGYNPSSTYFQSSIIDILDYTNTNKYKTVRSLVGTDINGAGGYILFTSSSWLSTSAITTISFNQGSNTFSQYSSFALYGIKGA